MFSKGTFLFLLCRFCKILMCLQGQNISGDSAIKSMASPGGPSGRKPYMNTYFPGNPAGIGSQVQSIILEYLSDRVREAEVSDRFKSAEVSDRIKSAEDRMKWIADRVYKVGRTSDEAESRSGYPGQLGIGYGWLRYGANRNKIAC
jgi:hypothetical protein